MEYKYIISLSMVITLCYCIFRYFMCTNVH